MPAAADPDRTRLLLVALVATSLAVLLTGSVLGLVAPGAAIGSQPTDEDHTDPSEVESAGGDLSAVERRMADQLAEQVRSGSVNLSQEDLDEARQQINGTEYESLLEDYTEVANETGQMNRSLALRDVHAAQLELTREMDRYWEQHDRYETARQRTVLERDPRPQGARSQRAAVRDRARDLESQWREINETHAELLSAYDRLAAVTDEEYGDATASINESVAEVNETQQAVRDAEFVETNLTVRADGGEISFADPLRVEGRLATAEGPVADETVRFAVGNQTIPTETDGAGRFDLTYRPTALSANATAVSIRYVPGNDSVHRSVSRPVPVTVERVEPAVSVDATPDQAAYNETLRVVGRVGTAAAGAPNVTTFVYLDGRAVSLNETGRDGRIRTNVTVPADVPPGQRSVRVATHLENRALEGANGSATVTVVDSETDLSVDVEHVEDRRVRVSGTLTAADGTPVRDRRVSVTANDTVLGTVTTGSDGRFDEEFDVPDAAVSAGAFERSEVAAVVVSFDGAGTNLDSSRATGSATLSVFPVGWLILAGVLGLGLLVGLVVVGRRLLRRWAGSRRPSAIDGTETPYADPFETGPERPASELIDIARDQLSDGRTEGAIAASYAALRRQFETDVGRQDALTPWEFYRACADSEVDDGELRVVREMTQLYERVQFRSDPPPTEQADEVLTRLEDVC